MAEAYDREIPEKVQELFNLCDLFRQKDGPRELLETLLDMLMRAEAHQHIKAGRYQRTPERRGHLNGTKDRTMNTLVGRLDLEVPQVRGCEPYRPSMYGRWQRSQVALLVACAEMFFAGVSTRRVRGVLQQTCGLELSASEVSRMAAELDEKLQAMHSRRLDTTEYPYVIIDARYEKARCNHHIVSQAVLVTAGITLDGRREILDWRAADSESEDTWSSVFVELKSRGLKGVKLIVSDAHKGIRAAVARHFQGVPWQRCRVHFKRELLHKVSWKDAKDLMRDIRSVLEPEERIECLRRAEEMATKWDRTAPGVAKMLRNDFESCLTVCVLPPDHRRKLNSTNMLERVMRDLKQRTRVVGIFPNAASCERLIGARLAELHENWQLEKTRYLSMESLNRPEFAGAP